MPEAQKRGLACVKGKSARGMRDEHDGRAVGGGGTVFSSCPWRRCGAAVVCGCCCCWWWWRCMWG